MENLALWNRVDKTDPAITKKAKIGGNNITAIDPQFQRKAATEQFGPFGIGWGIQEEKWQYLDIGETKLCHYTAQLWYILDGKGGEFPINANVKVAYRTQGTNSYVKVDDEFAKKVQTNAITKGLSALGFNSDVFEGKFDDNKYVEQRRQETAQKKPKLTLDESFDVAIKTIGKDKCTKILSDKFSLTPEDWAELPDEMKQNILAAFREEAKNNG